MALILSGDTGVPASGMPTGSVIQTVQANYSTNVNTTSTSPVTTNLTASITPISATSKILVIATMQGVYRRNGDVNSGVNLFLYRNGANLVNYALAVGYTNSTVYNLVGGNTINYLDSPATTSSTTYTIYFSSNVSGQSVSINADADTSTITLLEIKA